ncbi:Glyoxylate/hydroxypyruvate reductase A [Hartmannibacter diazotrophicus]|uniref:Glyoxylate/hydroxypyruvate reductase A n=1 Tax=Hartmannibacter diazotrophicus TaxID=1482074 RepID=A0A2C9D5X0_9HYPH|nr:glyoxylate/hydroxypyruvate reductase A [Hartmannibacter diazotrophicus]SON55696.1 Glyoxylate/hydroxypyruvate reductase A [Hartmannibacter diazotrophicus]
MTRPIALVTRIDRKGEEDWLALLRERLPAETILPFDAMSDSQRAEAEIAIVANPDPDHVRQLPGLVWIHSLWAGVERLVAELGETAPPIVRLVDPELSRVMAEAVLAWTYYLHRDMPRYLAQQREAVWQQQDYRHPSTVRVGLLGLGELGRASAARLLDAGFQVAGWSRSPKEIEGVETVSGDTGLATLLGTSDIIVCLLPLTAQTRGLLNRATLEKAKPGASLINFGRGPIIVDDDLIALLDEGRLDHAVLDVFATEPLPAEAPFWRHPKVTVLPHISAPTMPETAASIVAGNIESYRATGQLPPVIDVRRGY